MTDVQAPTLTDFLLARIAEDEAVARNAIGKRVDISTTWSDVAVTRHIDRWSSVRVLAECDAKRRIVEDGLSQCGEHDEGDDSPHYPDLGWSFCDGCAAAAASDAERGWVWRQLALAHADHPDWREDWRP